jgi:hypothetical protein
LKFCLLLVGRIVKRKERNEKKIRRKKIWLGLFSQGWSRA